MVSFDTASKASVKVFHYSLDLVPACLENMQ